MSSKKPAKRRPRPTSGRGLLTEDRSDIRIVPAAEREWWERLSDAAKARFAERHRKKWTDEETKQLIEGDPDTDDYYELAARMGRGPGALRTRRSQMIHLLRDEYEYVQKAAAYERDPKANHKFADIAQVHRMLVELGMLDLPVHEQFSKARHLKQPREGWRGDNSFAVERSQRAQANEVKARLAALRQANGTVDGE